MGLGDDGKGEKGRIDWGDEGWIGKVEGER